jgi:uncharacterized membrane protein YhaH (DUF805 family)
VEFTGVACDHAVMNISSLLSPNGRLARGSFVPAVIAVYVASFLSQVLLSPSVTARAGVALFVLTQIVLIWIWMVLHTRRLRDAGRPTGIVIGIAMIYVLEVALLVLLVWLILGTAGPTGGASSEASIFHLFVFLYFLGLLTGDPTLGVLQIWVMGFAILMLLPIAIALIFSLWTATRTSLAPPP